MRLKLMLGNVLAILVLGTLCFFVVRQQIQSALGERTDDYLQHRKALFERSWRLQGIELVKQVESITANSRFSGIFSAVSDSSRRQSAKQAADQISTRLENLREAHIAPDIVVVTDDAGKVIARDKDINRMHGLKMTPMLPDLAKVLEQAHARHDVWFNPAKKKLFQVAMVPLRITNGGVMGAVIVGFDLSDQIAKQEAELLEGEVVFLVDKKIYGASLPTSVWPKVQRVVTRNPADTVWDISLDNHAYSGIVGALMHAQQSSHRIDFAILHDHSLSQQVMQAGYAVLIFMIIALIIVAIYNFMVGTILIRPIERIEETILAVLNGDQSARVNLRDGAFGGLAYRVNQLINLLTGVSEGGNAEAEDWQGIAFASTKLEGKSQDASNDVDDPALIAQLQQESEDDYLKRIYREYTDAKKLIGEDVSQLSFDFFTSQVKRLEQRAKEQHQFENVRMRVKQERNLVALVPVSINES